MGNNKVPVSLIRTNIDKIDTIPIVNGQLILVEEMNGDSAYIASDNKTGRVKYTDIAVKQKNITGTTAAPTTAWLIGAPNTTDGAVSTVWKTPKAYLLASTSVDENGRQTTVHADYFSGTAANAELADRAETADDAMQAANALTLQENGLRTTVALGAAGGTGASSVTTKIYAVQPDNAKDLAVYVPWTDTKVTSVGNHYTPSSSGTFSPAAGGTTTNISDTVINYIAGLQKDAAGHITGVVSSSIKADKNVNYYTTAINQTTAVDGFSATVVGNNSAVKGNFSIPAATTNSAGVMTTTQVNTLSKVKSATTAVEGLTKKPTGTAPISVSADNVITHDNSGVTAGVYGAAQTASFAGNVAISSIKIDAKGHVTTAGTVNIKMPSTSGLGTSAKDVKSVLFKANTSGSNNDFGVVLTFNDNTTISSIITNTLILNGNFTS